MIQTPRPISKNVDQLIMIVRGQRVILDADLAWLYSVPTKALNQGIKRNLDRFPSDFMFQLTTDEKNQLVTECDRFARLKHSSSLPYAFTEHGSMMAANVLNSRMAIEASIYLVRAFIELRQILSTSRQLNAKLNELEQRLEGHDSVIHTLVAAIRDLSEPILPAKRRKLGI